MNHRHTIRMGWLLAVVLAALTLPGWVSAETASHSGTIAAVDTAAGTIVLDEIGPWQVKGGVTQIAKRTIAVTSLTEFKRVTRVPGPGSTGWVGDFVEENLDPWPRFRTRTDRVVRRLRPREPRGFAVEGRRFRDGESPTRWPAPHGPRDRGGQGEQGCHGQGSEMTTRENVPA